MTTPYVTRTIKSLIFKGCVCRVRLTVGQPKGRAYGADTLEP
jgi:hypothetical protein